MTRYVSILSTDVSDVLGLSLGELARELLETYELLDGYRDLLNTYSGERDMWYITTLTSTLLKAYLDNNAIRLSLYQRHMSEIIRIGLPPVRAPQEGFTLECHKGMKVWVICHCLHVSELTEAIPLAFERLAVGDELDVESV